MASFEYVRAGWLRSRRLMVVSLGAGRSCAGLCPRPLPRQGGDWGPGTFWLVVGAWVGAVGGGLGSTQGGVPQCIWCLCGPCSRRCGAEWGWRC